MTRSLAIARHPDPGRAPTFHGAALPARGLPMKASPWTEDLFWQVTNYAAQPEVPSSLGSLGHVNDTKPRYRRHPDPGRGRQRFTAPHYRLVASPLKASPQTEDLAGKSRTSCTARGAVIPSGVRANMNDASRYRRTSPS